MEKWRNKVVRMDWENIQEVHIRDAAFTPRDEGKTYFGNEVKKDRRRFANSGWTQLTAG